MATQEFHFNVYGRVVAITDAPARWSAFTLTDGKRVPAGFVVPAFLAEDELCQYLADLFHESATPTNGDVTRIL